MPTQLIRIELLFTEAQLKDIEKRFPDHANGSHKERIYDVLGIEPPESGGQRPGAGRVYTMKKFQIYVVNKKDKTFFNVGVETATSARAAVRQAKETNHNLFKYVNDKRFTIKAEPA